VCVVTGVAQSSVLPPKKVLSVISQIRRIGSSENCRHDKNNPPIVKFALFLNKMSVLVKAWISL
jgi:hypothetical protein